MQRELKKEGGQSGYMLKSNRKTRPFVSVVIPFYNEENCLPRNFESLISQKYLRYSIINLKRNKGVAHARNVGIRRSKGELVWLVDADCIADEKALAFLVQRLIKENLDCVMGSYTLQSPGDSRLAKYRFEASKSNKTDLCKRPYPLACNNLYKKRVFDDILFNEKYVGAGLEDREFGERFLQKFRVGGECKAKVYHQLQEATLSDYFRKKIWYGRSQATYYIDKHHFVKIVGLAQMLLCLLLFWPIFLMVSDSIKVLVFLWLLINIYLFFFKLFPQVQVLISSNQPMDTEIVFVIFSAIEKFVFLWGFIVGLAFHLYNKIHRRN